MVEVNHFIMKPNLKKKIGPQQIGSRKDKTKGVKLNVERLTGTYKISHSKELSFL